MPKLLLIIVMAMGFSAPARACAVPTRIEVENRSSRPPRAAFVEGGTVNNQLPHEELRPGATAIITLPSCMGTYTVVTESGDGTRVRHTGLDAGTIRGLIIR
ncbi:MAG: hypothetical protein JWO26_2380 [Rhodospirillales bacterium]|jgi:hypothetical protein|nr:hypothetical protein [Rhodospirillales bacterium]